MRECGGFLVELRPPGVCRIFGGLTYFSFRVNQGFWPEFNFQGN